MKKNVIQKGHLSVRKQKGHNGTVNYLYNKNPTFSVFTKQSNSSIFNGNNSHISKYFHHQNLPLFLVIPIVSNFINAQKSTH